MCFYRSLPVPLPLHHSAHYPQVQHFSGDDYLQHLGKVSYLSRA